ncbi:MAG: alpha/beta hydrolase [Cytophagales bacterium]|nr:alpha/beta hydrolase [Cytophagales bacterium]MCA6370034.1 alpha/beta hydrolase [Cytophagales bacterium]MCA6375215.1 alpha/beta hydrolase [Cytophagales bacterium]MCA6384270.1 alpha/beta hydrolase [Cytophagales bacterium]
MENKIFIKTKLGKIAVFTKTASTENTPIIFLHGVYLDHLLWKNQVSVINDRTVIAIDMPLHGESVNGIPIRWTLADCADMLVEILDEMKISKAIAVGHSWGSMTILRAASKYPDRFESVGFCNMPFEAASKKEKRNFKLQHSALIFRNFYMKQTSKVLFGKETLKHNPGITKLLTTPMSKLTNREIKKVDQFVIIDAEDATTLLSSLKVPAIALKGKDDYVPTPTTLKTTIVPGAHLSPIESPTDVSEFCKRVINLK